MSACPKCNCSYTLAWGIHHCKNDLPPYPKEFFKEWMAGKPKADFWDRQAWLSHVTTGNPVDWKAAAEYERERASGKAIELKG